MLINSDNFESVAREIARVAIGDRSSPFDWLGYVPIDPSKVKTPPLEPAAIEVDRAILQACRGVYEVSADTVILVQAENGNAYVSSDGRHRAPFHAELATRFFAPDDAIRIAFLRDADGRVTGLTLELQGMELPAKKVHQGTHLHEDPPSVFGCSCRGWTDRDDPAVEDSSRPALKRKPRGRWVTLLGQGPPHRPS